MLKLAIAAIAVTLVAPAQGAPTRLPATVAQVLDAATYLVDVEIGGRTTRITVGLPDVYAPKLYGSVCERQAAFYAKSFSQRLLQPDDSVLISNLTRASGRFVGDIEFEGRNLKDVLVGFRQLAPTGAPTPWCEGVAIAQ